MQISVAHTSHGLSVVKIVVRLKSLSSSIANGRSFTMVIGMVFLHQGIVPFSQNLAGVITDNDATNRAPSFFIAFLRQRVPQGA